MIMENMNNEHLGKFFDYKHDILRKHFFTIRIMN